MGNDIKRKLKIGIISPPWFAVPPIGYGGIESVVSLLADGLQNNGHDVTLFASGDSITRARLISVFETAPTHEINNNIHLENIHSLNAYKRAGDFDVIHDHDGGNSRLLGSLANRLTGIPVIATMHGPADVNGLNFYKSVAGGLFYIAISDFQRSSYTGIEFLSTIPNAIKVQDYPFSPSHKGYLLFVGRMNEEKGAHLAVSVARSLGKKLILIGKCREPHERLYFEHKVQPFLTNDIEYFGEVDFASKLELYRHAECVLFPVQWAEPFGLVMIEAMACGSPVVAIRNGSVPEVINNGITGWVVESREEMVEAVKRIGLIDRANCRNRVLDEYGEIAFIKRHEQAYMRAIELSTAIR
jgi:glycosyltransferase involved in cell wall biosynthesis